MSNYHLIKKIKYLQNIQPREEWQKANREFLLQQIGAKEREPLIDVQGLMKQAVKLFILEKYALVAQPIVAIILVAVLVLAGGIATVSASRQSLPGDTLYNIKLAVEKTRVVLTLDETEKTKLHVEFADRRAKELAEIIAESGVKGGNGRVAQAAEGLKSEIETVKLKLDDLKKEAGPEEAFAMAMAVDQKAEELGITWNKVAEQLPQETKEKVGVKVEEALVTLKEITGRGQGEAVSLAEEATGPQVLPAAPEDGELAEPLPAVGGELPPESPAVKESQTAPASQPKLAPVTPKYQYKVVSAKELGPSAMSVFSNWGHSVFNDPIIEIENIKKTGVVNVFNQPPKKSVFE